MKPYRLLVVLVVAASIWSECGNAFSENLVWQTSKETAVTVAISQRKRILLFAGRESCGNCQYMKYTVCESTSPPIKSAIEQSFIPWFCDVDNSTEWYPYAVGLGTFSLPLICVVEPNNANAFLDRTVGVQDQQEVYSRLLQYTAPVLDSGNGKIPDTGQAISYTSTLGEDSDYTINPPSYTKLDANGNALAESVITWAMVKDNVTGLVWENKTNDGGIHDKDDTYTWQAAQDAYIAQLNNENFGGHSDWRLPSAKELTAIVDKDRQSPSIHTGYFLKTMPSGYWSSTTGAGNHSDCAWSVNFFVGGVQGRNKSNPLYVRAVCGEPSGILGDSVAPERMVDNGDNTVTDTATGFMWQKMEGGAMSWEAALSYCENSQLAGYTDWRLPNTNELQSIVDYSEGNPSTDTASFPGTVSAGYWSSTSLGSFSDAAWCVHFNYGLVAYYAKTNSLNVRAVRATPVTYFVNELSIGGNTEYRCFSGSQHFMTLIVEPTGTLALRPHPGVDPNGWGSTWYLHPFANNGFPAGAVDIKSVVPSDQGISIAISGNISLGGNESFGAWSLSMIFQYTAARKQVTGTGRYMVNLSEPLNSQAGDLSLFKIASNYLTSVPLLGGGTGDTGDMTAVDVTWGMSEPYDFQSTWIPAKNVYSHYPQETTDRLAINVIGAYNRVDTAAQGLEPIVAAYKPSLALVISSREAEAGAGLTFGAAYCVDPATGQFNQALAEDFSADNVGILPMIRVGNLRTSFDFDVNFDAAAIPGDTR